MRLQLDTVRDTDFQLSAYDGQYIRTGLLTVQAGDLPLSKASTNPGPIIRALGTSGMPQIGDVMPVAGYDDWVVRRHIIRPVTALNWIVLIGYQWLGTLRIRDTSTLSSSPFQIHPKFNMPFLARYGRTGTTQNVWKQVQLPYPEPLRHLVMSKTVKYEARQAVLDAFGTVNKPTWMGLPEGYWLFSGLDGDTIDDGQTFTYTVTCSTRQRRDWSEYGTITDERGQAIVMNKVQIQQMEIVKARSYSTIYGSTSSYTVPGTNSAAVAAPGTGPFGVDNSAEGFIRSAMLEMSDFGSIFGVGAAPPP